MTGTLTEVRRYPVKSLEGELLPGCDLTGRGLDGDRWWSVRDPDGRFGSGKSSRRFRRMDGLRDLVARYDGEVPVIGFPDGTEVRGDDPGMHEALSTHVGRPVRLEAEEEVSHFEDGPVHLVTTASLAALARAHDADVDARRMRCNMLVDTPDLDGFAEDEWLGREVRVGPEVVLRVVIPMPRCVMVTAATRDLGGDADLLKTITRVNDGSLGVLAEVVAAGTVLVGDRVELLRWPVPSPWLASYADAATRLPIPPSPLPSRTAHGRTGGSGSIRVQNEGAGLNAPVLALDHLSPARQPVVRR